MTSASGRPAVTTWARRRGGIIAAAGGAPLVAGLAVASPQDDAGWVLPCPFRAATGLPCPLCGSTRAVALAVRGDLDFTRYNAVMVAVLVAMLAYGLIRVATAGRESWVQRFARTEARLSRAPATLLLALTVIAWSWTLAHRETIAP